MSWAGGRWLTCGLCGSCGRVCPWEQPSWRPRPSSCRLEEVSWQLVGGDQPDAAAFVGGIVFRVGSGWWSCQELSKRTSDCDFHFVRARALTRHRNSTCLVRLDADVISSLMRLISCDFFRQREISEFRWFNGIISKSLLHGTLIRRFVFCYVKSSQTHLRHGRSQYSPLRSPFVYTPKLTGWYPLPAQRKRFSPRMSGEGNVCKRCNPPYHLGSRTSS